MKSIVLDGDKIAEAIQKAKDKMINAQNDPPKENGEYLCYYEYNTSVMVTTTACTAR